ncbi:MAG TPA: phosphoribosylformylglycinamidine synthase subunit PurL [Solirubrobacteraceae bacterium]|nr:phosphoribosylformylglycinamidine synthase subunit PurL [Solirubrobacteraceae bacterium]
MTVDTRGSRGASERGASSGDRARARGLAIEPGGAPVPTREDALALGLTAAEYELVCEKQGGAPNRVELAMYSLLWSEHCAYKHSKKLLRTLPTEGEHVVMGPGENAGAVDVGGGLVCAFKVESHNHPSAVEPFQGAATGVGGILRDIFAIGARPIAVLDSLRFGELEDGATPAAGGGPRAAPAAGGGEAAPPGSTSAARSRYLLDGAVSGIGHYGNSIGVPTVGGEVYFEAPYESNCLVNAMALGLARRERLVRSAAAGPGNVVVLFGASTGRDGIGGASVLASAELGEDEDKRPSVQVGDPFEEKKLMECSLELLERGLIVSLQDLGAAGLTSSAAEMAAKGGVGIDLDVARVPLREGDMEPFEIMVSESQERMLCVVEPARLEAVLALCEKWEVNCAAIGTVTAASPEGDGGRMRVYRDGELVGDMPVRALVDECPLYDLAPRKPAAPVYAAPRAAGALGAAPRAAGAPAAGAAPPALGAAATPQELLLALLSCANLCSRRPLFERYDSIVQSRTVRRPEQADAAVLALPDGSALAVSIDCNGRRVAADPYAGTVEAALECAANLACAGAQPLGATNNLNFGNPEKPHIAWQLSEAVRGLGDACRALRAPIVGGNVSLYNEGAAGPIYPTPVIGMVGRLPDARAAGRLGFARAGDEIALVGPFAPALPASELAKLRGEPLPDGLPAIDAARLAAVIAAQQLVRRAVADGLVASAHDIAEGGLAVALAECCLAGGVGARVELDDGAAAEDGAGASGGAGAGDGAAAQPGAGGWERALFGEAPGGFVLSAPAGAMAQLAERARAGGVALARIGEVGGEQLALGAGEARIALALGELAAAHAGLDGLFA